MSDKLEAFQEPIDEGLVRILLRISSIECEVENDAPDFVNPKEDTPAVKVIPETNTLHLTDVFQESYPLMLNERKSKDGKLVWNLEQEGIWFDIPMQEVKDIWLSDFNFYLESKKPRYLAYYIKDVQHRIEWLQKEEKSGEIRSLSEFKKTFSPSPVTDKDHFNGSEVIRCADMIGRAVRKIDIRTRMAMVKFNTDKGRLEPLLIEMAAKLGFSIEALDKDTIYKEGEQGNNVSHTISLTG